MNINWFCRPNEKKKIHTNNLPMCDCFLAAGTPFSSSYSARTHNLLALTALIILGLAACGVCVLASSVGLMQPSAGNCGLNLHLAIGTWTSSSHEFCAPNFQCFEACSTLAVPHESASFFDKVLQPLPYQQWLLWSIRRATTGNICKNVAVIKAFWPWLEFFVAFNL